MFLDKANLMEVMGDAGKLRSGLFIGGEGWFAGEIFSRCASVPLVSCFLQDCAQASKEVAHSRSVAQEISSAAMFHVLVLPRLHG